MSSTEESILRSCDYLFTSHQCNVSRQIDFFPVGLHLSEVLNCAIELWRNIEIDDHEVMEIAIRDVSYQIQLQKRTRGGQEKEVLLRRLSTTPSSRVEFFLTKQSFTPDRRHAVSGSINSICAAFGVTFYHHIQL